MRPIVMLPNSYISKNVCRGLPHFAQQKDEVVLARVVLLHDESEHGQRRDLDQGHSNANKSQRTGRDRYPNNSF